MSYYSQKIPQIVEDHCRKHAPNCVGCSIRCKAPTNNEDFSQWVEAVIRALEARYEGSKDSLQVPQ